MTQDEKDSLLTLFAKPTGWCQQAEARDCRGEAVHYHDPEAVAWDIVGGMCRLFGWSRSMKLFAQTWRQITGRRPGCPELGSEMHAMRSLQDFNDLSDTDYDLVISRIRGVRVWS